ncbi:MAG: aldo/keto reductase [Pseudomonadaceae bacterium]
MKSVVVLQVRTNSSRLPGKVLLPINGYPIAVLAALRAANTGRQVIVATSVEQSDDGLASLIENYGLNCFRGSLDNTLDRFVSALTSWDDNTIVYRLTGDNLFPDGAFLDEVENEFLEKQIDYMGCDGEASGLPYGVSAEVTWLKHLREANRASTKKYDQEHVTPYIIRKFGFKAFEKYKSLSMEHYRCTIDCLDDYYVNQQVFSGISDPVNVSTSVLIANLKNSAFQPLATRPIPKLVLGTAQLGFDYGIANTIGQPNWEISKAIIKSAISSGVVYLDTARGYGESEEVIGQALSQGWAGRVTVITKLSALQDCPKEAPQEVANAFVNASFFQSCNSLRFQEINILMLHRASHLTDWSGAVWKRLLDLQAEGLIGELGVSAQNPEELEMALENSQITFIQIPFNILDWRWEKLIPEILKTKASRKLIIHSRSALLQGLLVSSDERHWHRANVTKEDQAVVGKWLIEQVKGCARLNVTDLCLSYVNSLPWIDGIVLGMETLDQLKENIDYFNRSLLSEEQIDSIKITRPKLGRDTLNPALWKTTIG